MVLTAREERISDVVDSVPVIAPEGIFDAVGNIGSGRREELQLDFNLPLDGAGLRGMTLKGSALLRDSQVVEPLTSERRPISEDLPAEAAVDLTQDLTELRLRWGVGYALHEVKPATRWMKSNAIASMTVSAHSWSTNPIPAGRFACTATT